MVQITQHSDDFHHPLDTPVSSSLRFLAELIAWVAGPWALALLSTWLILPALVFLVAIPAVFSTRNDKRTVVVPTPGPIRVALELLLHVVALDAPWFVWPCNSFWICRWNCDSVVRDRYSTDDLARSRCTGQEFTRRCSQRDGTKWRRKGSFARRNRLLKVTLPVERLSSVQT